MKAFKLFIVVFILCVGFVVFSSSVKAYYACGGGPCNGSYPCNGGLSCNPNPGGVCGTYYNTCSGTTCNGSTGFDSSTCNTVGCNNAGTTNTAAWTYGACTTNCGPNTRIGTCSCSTVNNCSAASCASPVGACGGTYSDATCACVSQNPQTAPASVTASQTTDGGGVPIRQALISWTFPSITNGCGNDWGNNCAGNSDDFILRYDGGATTETEPAASGTINHTSGLLTWGAHSVIVCARNGFGEKCAASVPFTLTAPTCSVSGQTSDPACRNTDPPLSASFGNNADQIQFLVKQGSSTLSAPFAAQSSWLGANPASYAPSLATNTYYWNVNSQSTTSPAACVTPAVLPTGIPLNIDKTAPTVPSGNSFTVAPDGTCLNKYFVTYQWGASTDIGCGSPTITYQSDIASDSGHVSLVNTNSTGPRQITTTSSYPGDTILYGRAQAVDGVSNPSGWSADESTSFTLPTPTLYPTIFLSGNYKEKTDTCGDMTVDPNNFNLSISANLGVTPICQKLATSYSCNITIDNQNTPCITYPQTIMVNASYSGYSSVVWSDNSCDNNSPTIDINTPGDISKDLDFVFDTTQGWFKTSATSFTNKTVRNSIFPYNVTAYDSDDDASRHVIAKEAGVVLNSSSLTLGANAIVGGQTEYSTNNWSVSSYVPNSIFTPSKFVDYMKSRKKYKTITNISEIDADGVFYSTGDLVIDNTGIAQLNGKKVVIIADNNTVTINNNIASPAFTSGALSIIANQISINGVVTEVDAILIGNTVDAGSGLGLKIDGNLIQLNTGFTNSRLGASAQKPSLFVKVNQTTYMDLLPYLSISMYDWKQLQ